MNAALLSLTLVFSLLTGQYAPTQGGSQPLEPHLEARVQQLGKQLRCAVCQGVSIADSPASMARAQLDTVRELVAEGKTDQEVVDYFVARYGEWVLLEPTAEGFNWFVWLGPVALVALGGIVIWRQLQRGPSETQTSQQTATPAPTTETPSKEAEDPYLAAVRRELER